MDEFMGFSIVVVIIACMAWIWRKLKDIETQLKERDLVQQKHNEHVSSELSAISHDAMNKEWERNNKDKKL
jgi:hypothetical protein